MGECGRRICGVSWGVGPLVCCYNNCTTWLARWLLRPLGPCVRAWPWPRPCTPSRVRPAVCERAGVAAAQVAGVSAAGRGGAAAARAGGRRRGGAAQGQRVAVGSGGPKAGRRGGGQAGSCLCRSGLHAVAWGGASRSVLRCTWSPAPGVVGVGVVLAAVFGVRRALVPLGNGVTAHWATNPRDMSQLLCDECWGPAHGPCIFPQLFSPLWPLPICFSVLHWRDSTA